MIKQILKDAIGWGFVLWFFGYSLGIMLFAFVPANVIGWVIMPIGILATVAILTKRVKGKTLWYYLLLAMVWTLIAVVFDYIFLVKTFKPIGYYKLDVYIYYSLTFILPLAVGWRKQFVDNNHGTKK